MRKESLINDDAPLSNLKTHEKTGEKEMLTNSMAAVREINHDIFKGPLKDNTFIHLDDMSPSARWSFEHFHPEMIGRRARFYILLPEKTFDSLVEIGKRYNMNLVEFIGYCLEEVVENEEG